MNPGNELILIVAGLVAITVVVVNLLRLIQSVMTNRTLREAISKDPAQAERMLAALAQRDGAGDGRTAAMLIAVGIAVFAASIIAHEGWMKYGIGASLFPLLIGAALLLREAIVRRARRAGP
jgi:hypothetical protein